MIYRFATLFLFAFLVYIPSAHTQTFCRTLGTTVNERSNNIISTNDGGYAMVGYSQTNGWDVYVVKLSATGDVEWEQTIGGSSDDRGFDIVQTSDGGYAIAGYSNSYGNGNYDCYVVKLFPNGALDWAKVIGDQTEDDFAYSIIQATDGDLLIAGYTLQSGMADCFLAKLSNTGNNLIWSKSYGGSLNDYAYDVIQTSDGGFALTGSTESGGPGEDVYILKTDINGSPLWERAVGGSNGTSQAEGNSIIQTQNGGYAIAGYSNEFGSGGTDMYLVILNSIGVLQWTKTLGGLYNDYASSLVQMQDGGLILCGSTVMNNGNPDLFLTKLTSNGSLLWGKRFGGTLNDQGSSVAKTNDGKLIIGGGTSSFGMGFSDCYIIKTGINGYNCCSSIYTPLVLGGGNSSTPITSPSQSGIIIGPGGTVTTTAGTDSLQCGCITVADAGPDFGVCNGSNFVLNASGGSSYLWSTGDTAASIALSATATTTYYVTVTDSCGTATDSVTVTVYDPPVLVSSHIDVSCNGGSDGEADVVVTSGSGSAYLWSNGNTSSTISNLSAGTYYVTVTDSNNCITIDTIIINEPTAFLTFISFNPPNVCHEETNVTASVSVGGGTPPYSYLWSTGGTGSSISGLGAGTYTVTITDSMGCTTTEHNTLYKYPALDGILTALDDSICEGECANLQLEILNGTGPYMFAYGTWPQIDTGIIGPVGNITNFFYCPDVTSLVAVGYIYDLSSSCGDTVYIAAQVVVHASPSPPTVFDDQSICEGDTAYLNAIGTGINWYDQDANLVASDKNNLIITDLMQGNHWFYATQTDPNTGCESMEADSALITVIGNNDIDAGRGDTICPGSKVQLFATGGGTYHWFPEELVSDPFIPDPLAFPEKDTWFYVEITIDSGCTFIDSVFIAMDKGDNCWHVFNAFSPNGDGTNDFWFIQGIEQYPDNWVEIYNRWGILVNKFNHYNNLKTVWDGTNFEGAELPESTYYFILHVSDGRHSGWVQIIR